MAAVFIVGLVLSACETPSNEPKSESEAIGSFLRNAADISTSSYNYSAAAAYYQSLYDRDPDDVTAIVGLGRNLRYTGQSRQAIDLLSKSTLAHPAEVQILAELGKAWLAAGQAEKAIVPLIPTALNIDLCDPTL